MDLIILPQSASSLDRWSDRAIRIAYCEFTFALGLVIVASSYYRDLESDHPPMTKTKLAVALPMIFLPMASCITSWQPFRRRLRTQPSLTGERASHRAPTKPLIYSPFQIAQLIAASFVAAHDLIIFSGRSVWFWFSLVGGFLPALAGTVYGLVGIARFFFAESAQLILHHRQPSAGGDEYSDSTIEHCALERAYQQQFPDDLTDLCLEPADDVAKCQANGGDILLTQLRHETTHAQPQDVQNSEGNAAAQEPGASRAPTRDDQTRCQPFVSPSNKPRFRWQEQTGARDGGGRIWGPLVAMVSLMTMWGLYYRWLIRNFSYSSQLIRILALGYVTPIVITCLGNGFLSLSLYKPLLALIFTAFCFSVLASIVWFAEFVYSMWCFLYYMRQLSIGYNLTSFGLVCVSLMMTSCHIQLVRCSVKMEWTPGYNSLGKEYELWKQRRNEAEAEAEGAEDAVA